MIITITNEDGYVQETFSMTRMIEEAAKEHPNDNREMHIQIAKGEVLELLENAINHFYKLSAS